MELTTTEAAERLGLSRRRVQALIKDGRLPGKKRGRDWFVTEAAVAKYKPPPMGRPKLKGKRLAVRSLPRPTDPGDGL